jgi:hypothetical protein
MATRLSITERRDTESKHIKVTLDNDLGTCFDLKNVLVKKEI